MNNPRFSAILELIGRADTVADIGCDHGYVGAALLESGAAKKVWFTDVSEKALSRAQRLVREKALPGACFFAGDGFAPLPETPDAAVIAGMGGETIAHILSHPLAKTRAVLQPMRDAELLFRDLTELGFRVLRVYVVYQERRYYQIMEVCPGIPREDQADYPLSALRFDETARAFFEHRKRCFEKIVCQSEKAANSSEKTEKVRIQIQKINEVLASWPQ